MGDFRKLHVWQEARALATCVYRLTEGFPTRESFGLSSQLRRAAVSIMANVAEGCGRNRDKEFARYLSIALGSSTELESHLYLALDLSLLKKTEAVELFARIQRLQARLATLSRRIKARSQ